LVIRLPAVIFSCLQVGDFVFSPRTDIEIPEEYQ